MRAALATLYYVGFCVIAARCLQLPRELDVLVSLLAVFLGNLLADGMEDDARRLGSWLLSLYISGLILAGLLDPAGE